MVNDISGGNADPDMLATVATLEVPYICMHMKGDPQTMQKNPVYENVHQGSAGFFYRKKKAMSSDAGIKDIIIDPGFGFGKNDTA